MNGTVVCGDFHTIVVKKDGTLWGLGRNTSGQLGLGDAINRSKPEQISVADIKQVAGGMGYTVFLKNDGSVWACGDGSHGQLGLGDTRSRVEPTSINISEVKQVASRFRDTFFLKKDGTVWACGENHSYKLGIGGGYGMDNQLLPIQVNITDVADITCGQAHNIFLKADGTVWGCGNGAYGGLGLGTEVAYRSIPTKIPITDVKQVVCGEHVSMFLKNDETVWACGNDNFGQFGLGGTGKRLEPVKLNITNVKQVAYGYYHSVFLKNDSTVWTCGYNYDGELGLGDTINRNTPVQVQIDNVGQIACGYYSTIMIKNDGTIWWCGSSALVGTNPNATNPTKLDISLESLLFLLSDANGLCTLKDGALIKVDEEHVNTEIIRRVGFHNINDLIDVSEELERNYDVLIFNEQESNTSIQFNHLTEPQLIAMTEDIDISAYATIGSITLTTVGAAGTIKLALSFDSGLMWRTYANGWQPIARTPEALSASGMTVETLNSIPSEKWAQANTGTLRIAYYLAKSVTTDDLAVAALSIAGDTVSWELANHDDYQCSYSTATTMQIKLLSDGSYKINYAEQK